MTPKAALADAVVRYLRRQDGYVYVRVIYYLVLDFLRWRMVYGAASGDFV